jgi:adenylosuccinate synthase
VEPVYETHPGWMDSTREARRYEDLPANARSYLARIAEFVETPLKFVSIGSERTQTIIV